MGALGILGENWGGSGEPREPLGSPGEPDDGVFPKMFLRGMLPERPRNIIGNDGTTYAQSRTHTRKHTRTDKARVP